MKIFTAAAIVLVGSASIAVAEDQGSPRNAPERTTPSRDDPMRPPPASTPGVHGRGTEAGDPSPGPSIFDELDTNRDGRLSESEVSRMQGVDLRKLDADRNGVLDRGEWKKGADAAREDKPPTRAGGSFDSVDSDGDGSISKTEAAAIFDAAEFSKMDRNRNGVIDRNEYGALARRGGQSPAAPSGKEQQ